MKKFGDPVQPRRRGKKSETYYSGVTAEDGRRSWRSTRTKSVRAAKKSSTPGGSRRLAASSTTTLPG